MNKNIKILLAGAAILTLGYLAVTKGSRLANLADKFIVNVGAPRVHNIKGGYINLILDQIQITNQSEFTTQISNLFVTVQYLRNGSWQNMFVQRQAIAPFNLPVYGTTKLPSIGLSMPLTEAANLVQLLHNNTSIRVVTRLMSNGIEIPIETIVDARSYIQPVIDIVKNPLLIFN